MAFLICGGGGLKRGASAFREEGGEISEVETEADGREEGTVITRALVVDEFEVEDKGAIIGAKEVLNTAG